MKVNTNMAENKATESILGPMEINMSANGQMIYSMALVICKKWLKMAELRSKEVSGLITRMYAGSTNKPSLMHKVKQILLSNKHLAIIKQLKTTRMTLTIKSTSITCGMISLKLI